MSKKKPRPKPKPQAKKQASKPKTSQEHLPKKVQSMLETLLQAKAWDELRMAFQVLEEEYPKAPELYAIQVYAAQELNNDTLRRHASYHWARLAPYHPDAISTWAFTAMDERFPGHARRAAQRLLQYWPEHPNASVAAELLEKLDSIWDELLQEIGLDSQPEALQLLCWHEDAQMALAEQRYAEAISYGRKLLSQHPQYPAAYNNISLAQFALGKLDEAIETCQTVLREYDADNIHAISNLAHYLAISNQPEAAAEVGKKLKSTHSERDDLWIKKVEGLSFLGDFPSVIDCFEEAEAKTKGQNTSLTQLPHAAMLHHLAAVAYAQGNQLERARTLWKQALELDPELSIAQSNLEELGKPVMIRHSPWPFTIFHWLPRKQLLALLPLMEEIFTDLHQQSDNADFSLPETISSQVSVLLEEHPSLLDAQPVLLHLGSPDTCELVFILSQVNPTPEHLQLLTQIATQSQTHSMLFRIRLLSTLVQTGQLQRGQQITLWEDGAPTERLLLFYEVHPPQNSEDSPSFEDSDGEETPEEVDSEKLQESSNDIPFLGMSPTQERAALDIIKQAHEALRQKQFEQADQLLLPIRQQSHFTQEAILALCDVSIELHLHQGQRKLAYQWLELAHRQCPKHPVIRQLQKKFGWWAKCKRFFGKS